MTRLLWTSLLLSLGSAAAGCSSDPASADGIPTVVYRRDVQPVTRADEALPGVAVPPFEVCQAPLPAEAPGTRDGQVCTQVAVAGATEPGRSFAAYADCNVVRTQRPYWPAPPAKAPNAADPRLSNPAYAAEVRWVTEQVKATACTCCHDTRHAPPSGPSQWFTTEDGAWVSTVSDGGAALFAGLADSSVLGAFPASMNNGFQRDVTGLPSTDAARMRAFWMAELEHRGISETEARATPPFGGPIYAASVAPPRACTEDEGVGKDGTLRWSPSVPARYVFVLAEGSKNPGVPPNLDKPAGTLWRLDVLAREPAIAAGFRYGTTPPGSFQALPEDGSAPALVSGTRYQLAVMRDIGFPGVNCLFTAP